VGTFIALVKGKGQTENRNRSPGAWSSVSEPKYTCMSVVCNGESLVSIQKSRLLGAFLIRKKSALTELYLALPTEKKFTRCSLFF